MCEKTEDYLSEIIPNNNKLIERALEIISTKIKDTLKYKNKESKIKGIFLLSENPLKIRLSQKKYGRNSERIFSRKSFFLKNKLPNKIKKTIGNNYRNIETFGVKNPELLKILKIFDSGKWTKTYILSENGKKEVHFFQSENGLIYDFKTIEFD